jgi:acyl-CoA reductase-like NAD-dependent aldehyde dehydrogenase
MISIIRISGVDILDSDQHMRGELEQIRALVGGVWRDPEAVQEIRDPYRGDVVALMPLSTARDCDNALDAAFRAKEAMAALPGYKRAQLLRDAASSVEAKAGEIALVMTRESGKAIRDSIVEVNRSAETLRLCAEEAVRIEGEHHPMDASANGAGRIALSLRFPVGVVAGITPFNSPVNLATHKLGPALAAGNCIVLKPSPKAPACVHKFVEAVVEAGFPAGAISTLYGDAISPQLVQAPQVDFVSFTGSIPVGKIIRGSAGMKRVALELGGVGPTFVHGDASIASAARACAANSVALAGQSCVSVQNVYVHRSVFDVFVEAVGLALDEIRLGDPMDQDSVVGTMIDEQSAVRVEGLVTRALEAGARAVRLGRRDGALYGGTILTDVRPDMDIVCQEVFGPTMTVQPYDDIAPIFREISASPYGLQCGIFTNSIDLALQAVRGVRTGGVIINGTSRWRSDQMPYGGVKDSGIGREGPKFAIRDMTEERLVVFNN